MDKTLAWEKLGLVEFGLQEVNVLNGPLVQDQNANTSEQLMPPEQAMEAMDEPMEVDDEEMPRLVANERMDEGEDFVPDLEEIEDDVLFKQLSWECFSKSMTDAQLLQLAQAESTIGHTEVELT